MCGWRLTVWTTVCLRQVYKPSLRINIEVGIRTDSQNNSSHKLLSFHTVNISSFFYPFTRFLPFYDFCPFSRFSRFSPSSAIFLSPHKNVQYLDARHTPCGTSHTRHTRNTMFHINKTSSKGTRRRTRSATTTRQGRAPGLSRQPRPPPRR